MSFADWVISFTEAEGCFTNNKEYPEFCISQEDRHILEKIKRFFEMGNIYRSGDCWQYKVIGFNCWYIRNLFENKLLLDKKKLQFEKWKQLKWAYFIGKLPQIPQDLNFEHWLLGFIEGEGSFCSSNREYPIFSLSQDEYDIIYKIKDFFGVGHIYKDVANCWQYRANGKYCNPIHDFCEGRLQVTNKIKQFEDWKQLAWWRPIPKHHENVIIKEPRIVKVSFKSKDGKTSECLYAE